MPPRRLLTPPPPPLPLLLRVPSHDDHNNNNNNHNLNPSLLFISGIVVIVFVVSLSLHLLLRYVNRRCSTDSQSQSESDNDDDDDDLHVVPPEPLHVHRSSGRRVAPDDHHHRHHQSLIDSLPLFSFSSVSSASSGDCAVCLSKFEPHDLLRLLPICCHAFHSRCIDTWLLSNHTCPLCRSTIHVDESESGYLKVLSSAASSGAGGDSFRIEIGSVSRRRIGSDSGDDRRRSYSMGSFDYLIDDENEHSEVVVERPPEHRRGASECSSFGGKKSTEVSSPAVGDRTAVIPPGADVAAEVAAGGRGWLREYVDRIASSSSSSFSSFRRSGRIFTGSSRRTAEGFSGSSRRSEGAAAAAASSGGGSWDFDRNGLGEEISNFFRWLSGV